MIQVIIIDDHLITRMGLKVLLKEILPIHKVDEAEVGSDALELFKTTNYDLCLLDLNIPKTDTMELLRLIRIRQPRCKVLVVSMNNEDIYAINVMKNGAKGFVSKANGYDDIKTAILKVLDNKKFVSENIISLLIDADIEKQDANPFHKLTDRELAIAKLLCEGYPTKAIAIKSSLQLSTVSTYKSKIFEKMQVKNAIELFELSRMYNLLGDK